MGISQSPLGWTRGYYQRGPGSVYNTQSAWYRMSDLVRQGYIPSNEGAGLLMQRGLVDLMWQVIWPEDYETADDDIEKRLADAEGFVVFIHGWTGNHSIWEDLPGLVVKANRRLVALSIDHNGFGQTRFVNETPSLENCCPPSAMTTIEQWVNVLKIRRQLGETRFKVINFVGHSMGGAALFYLNPINWSLGEETRYALAPALLMNDTLHQIYFNAMGIGIGLVNRLRFFEPVENVVKPGMVQAVCEGSSDFVKQAHLRQYNETPRGTTAATFRAMGLLQNWEIARRWDLFRVMLGHKDTLVGLTPMMDMLSAMEMPPSRIRVVAGSHYMFSVGPDTAFQHAQNRELVIEDILSLHEQGYHLLKHGTSLKRKVS